MKSSQNPKMPNSILLLWDEIIRRFFAPVGQVSFWIFLVLGIIIFSACGIWIELIKHWITTPETLTNLEGVQTAVFTFIPAIACPASMQLIYSANDKKYLRSFGHFVGVVLLLAAIVLFILKDHFGSSMSLKFGSVLSVISILTWWIANGLDYTFYDTDGQDATVGGGLDKELLGSVDDYKLN